MLSSALLRTQTDERLAGLAAAGNDRAFEAIVERYRRPLLRYLRRMLSEQLAEDVVQATFLNAWSSLRRGAEIRDLRPWLYRIAHNAAINALKKVGEALEEVPESAGGFASEPAAELERRDEMRRALDGIAQLPSRQRAALLAVAIDGRAHSDVAAELGLTDGAVRQLVHRARHSLRAAATAITPTPLLQFMMSGSGEATVARVAEVAAGAGGAGAASMSLKAGTAAVLATGAVAAGGPKVADVVAPSESDTPTAQVGQPRQAVSTPSSPGPPASGAVSSATTTTTTATTSSSRSERRRSRAAAERAEKRRKRQRRRGAATGGAAPSARGGEIVPSAPPSTVEDNSGRGRGRGSDDHDDDRSGSGSSGSGRGGDSDNSGRGKGGGSEDADRSSGKGGSGKSGGSAKSGGSGKGNGSGKGKGKNGSGKHKGGSGSSGGGSGSDRSNSGSGSGKDDDGSGGSGASNGSGGSSGSDESETVPTLPATVTTPPVATTPRAVTTDSSGSGGG